MDRSDFWTRHNLVNMIVTKSSFQAKFCLYFLRIDVSYFLSSTGEETTVREQHCEPSRAHEQGKFVSISSLPLFGS